MFDQSPFKEVVIAVGSVKIDKSDEGKELTR
jgi:hypothetical protein